MVYMKVGQNFDSVNYENKDSSIIIMNFKSNKVNFCEKDMINVALQAEIRSTSF